MKLLWTIFKGLKIRREENFESLNNPWSPLSSENCLEPIDKLPGDRLYLSGHSAFELRSIDLDSAFI